MILNKIRHQCIETNLFGSWKCIEYVSDLGKLKFSVEKGHLYDEEYSTHELYVKHCPFCGYEAGK